MKIHADCIRSAGRRWCVALLLLIVSLAVAYPASAQQARATEYQVKAEYLVRFAQFVHWPPEHFSAPDEPVHIGIIGKDPFGAVLDGTVAGRLADGHRLIVRRLAPGDAVTGIDVLYFGGLRDSERRDLLVRLAGQAVITVGEGESFLTDGGGIALLRVGETIRFGVNLKAAQPDGLRIDARALASAFVKRDR